MTGRLTAGEPKIDGTVRQRKSRYFDPFPQSEAGVQGRNALIPTWPVHDLATVMSQDTAALEAVEQIAKGKVSADDVAKPYIRKAGHTRRVLAEVFRRASVKFGENGDLRRAFDGVATGAFFVPEDLDDGDPEEWFHARNYIESAARLMMIGSRRCSGVVVRREGEIDARGKTTPHGGGLDVCGVKIATDQSRRSRGRPGRPSLYCGAHQPTGPDGDLKARRDREAITRLLTAVGAGLPRQLVMNDFEPVEYEDRGLPDDQSRAGYPPISQIAESETPDFVLIRRQNRAKFD